MNWHWKDSGRYAVAAVSAMLFFTLAQGFAETFVKQDACTWSMAIEHAPWESRTSHAAAVFENKLWVLGGAADIYGTDILNDVWHSLDGIDWTLAVEHAAWPPRAKAPVVVFNSRMWLLGGVGGSGSDVWNSEDGVVWTEITADPPWGPRYGHGAAVFQNKIWVLGGSSETGNDVWSSPDGINWELVTEQASWPARDGFSVSVFAGKIWLLGGSLSSGSGEELNDIWYSSDGMDWIQATDAAPWPVRQGHNSFVYDDNLWVLAGLFIAGSGHQQRIVYLGDVWYSPDGVTWHCQTEEAPWDARSRHTCASFDGKLWVMGGKTSSSIGSVLNDVWYLEPNTGAGFSGAPVSGAGPLTVQFADESTVADIAGWHWDFGDGAVSADQHPSHEYAARGVYTVTLTVAVEDGCPASETKTEYITVYGTEHEFHTADQDENNRINLSELLRIVQFYNVGALHCQTGSEDDYAPLPGDTACAYHDSDYAPPDWHIGLGEVMRTIQFFNTGGYYACPDADPPTEDGFCAGSLKGEV